MELQTAARYRLLDELRGLDLISMMLYHGRSEEHTSNSSHP